MEQPPDEVIVRRPSSSFREGESPVATAFLGTLVAGSAIAVITSLLWLFFITTRAKQSIRRNAAFSAIIFGLAILLLMLFVFGLMYIVISSA
ncbi:hypothetical protein L596_007551 [Steinernema carpocapsae]|uniref:Uncharacterized protein n=1 Tax=Steinernema carpocapsae TaxID=34508 RepID=A0A4U5P9P1_STECR|nr:hypothetical protein L596_007551 [Steinernema carpocapsae]